MGTIKILIADDHELIHNGIMDMLRPINKYKIVGKALNGNEAVEKALALKPDIILMDINMPELNGIEATKIIIERLPESKVIALTQHEDSEYVTQFLRSGGKGYLLKNSKKEEFVDAIETIFHGKKYLSKEISARMANEFMEQTISSKPAEDHKVTLTKREREIIQKIADDMSNQQIADELHISLRTVETHRRNIMQKLKVNTVVALLKYASQHNIISFD